MATQQDLSDDLSVGLTEIRKTMRHYKLTDWKEYLVIRKPGCEGSFIVLAHPADTTDFVDRLIEFHKAEAKNGN